MVQGKVIQLGVPTDSHNSKYGPQKRSNTEVKYLSFRGENGALGRDKSVRMQRLSRSNHLTQNSLFFLPRDITEFISINEKRRGLVYYKK